MNTRITNGRFRKTAAITVASLSSRTIILPRKQLEAVPILIGGREVVEKMIKDAVDERNAVQEGFEANYLSDEAFERFTHGFESNLFSWWNNGDHRGETTWNLTFIDKQSDNKIQIDVSICGVEVYEPF